ncbi:hypothetical protein LCGC14_1620850 [marine sediment metagenome]|uniref:Uncharacterized protein n=1 Tax=marine sediment metagenome TaxID=412755 RepID=A0A0F9I5J1_9ZZZZ
MTGPITCTICGESGLSSVGYGAKYQHNILNCVPKMIAERDRLKELLDDLIKAFDSGNLEMNSPEIDPGDPEIPPHPWHEEWLSMVRAVLGEARK